MNFLELNEMFLNNNSLKSLDLSCSNINDNSFGIFSNGIMKNESIINLKLKSKINFN
jgi:hypothetical protein